MEAAGTAKTEARPHVAIVPAPGMGHLIPIATLARRLEASHGFEVTFLLTDLNPAGVEYLSTFPEGVHVETLPPPDLSDVLSTAKHETRIFVTISRSLPAIRAALARLTNLVAVVVDLFGSDVFDLAREAGAAPYMLFPSNAFALADLLHLPELDEKVKGRYQDMSEPLRLPGFVALEGLDQMDPFLDRNNDAYKRLVIQCRKYPMAEGIFINTFEAIEPAGLKALRNGLVLPNTPPIYPIGPLIARERGVVDRAACPCLLWLDQQPAGSVLYVCFGSGGTLPAQQLAELAAGLEMSGHRFLWVARPPSGVADAAFFGSSNGAHDDDPLWFLPRGFLDRTKKVGFVVPGWAPQVAVLTHEAIGGFLTHCGWNSTLEALSQGVPLIAWPLYAEQRMNAVMLAEDICLAIRPSVSSNDCVVRRDEVCRVVKSLMEGDDGKRVRSTAEVIRKAAESAVAEGGESTKALAHVADKWRRTAATAVAKATAAAEVRPVV